MLGALGCCHESSNCCHNTHVADTLLRLLLLLLLQVLAGRW
jgi:hypothetical protein